MRGLALAVAFVWAVAWPGGCASGPSEPGVPSSGGPAPGDDAAPQDDAPSVIVDAGGAGDTQGAVDAREKETSPAGGDAARDDGANPATDATIAQDASLGSTQIVVSAGAFDRANTIVSFPLPGGVGKSLALRGDRGSIPLQVDDKGVATFVLAALAAGNQATFALEATPVTKAVTAVKESDGIKVMIGSSTILRYQMQGKLPAGIDAVYLRGGYIHPLFTPAGAQVTDDYPSDHRHHHGIWGAWTKTMFNGHAMDFWNMGQKTAKVDFDSLESTWEGPVHAGLRAHHIYVDLVGPAPVTALREQWTVTAYKTHDAAPPYFVFDLESTQEAATNMPVVFEQYLYGGFAIRGSPDWRSAATFLTSEGLDRVSGDGTNGRWCYIGGSVAGKTAGYAILGHPTNFRAPQPLRIHPTDPYATFSPVKDSGFSIVPGTPYVTRFRFVATDGAPDKAVFDRIWNDFATPPTVTVKSPSR